MFEKVIVSQVIFGTSTVNTYRNISILFTDDEHILISDGIYTWRVKIDSIISIVII